MDDPRRSDTRTWHFLALSLFLAGEIIFALPGFAQRMCVPARGVNAHTMTGSDINAVPDMHLNWVRYDIRWATIQPAPGVWSWDWVDSAVEGARSRGLNILGILGDTPGWACPLSDPATDGACVPADPLQWRAYVAAVTNRYRGVIKAYEIWNEPDLKKFWHGNQVDYVNTILIPAGQVIRANDPAALIVAPALSGSTSSDAIPPYQFFNEIAAQNATSYVDIVSQHVYEADGGRLCHDFVGPDGILNRFFDGNNCGRALIYDIDHSTLANKPIWITETGFADGGWSGNGEDVLRLFEEFGPRTRVTGLFDFDLKDAEDPTGLLTVDGAWKTGATRLATSLPDCWNPRPPLISDGFDFPWSSNQSPDFRWAYPNAGQAVVNGALTNSVQSFSAKVRDVAPSDFEVSATVRMTNDLGSEWNWMGLLGRTANAADTFQQSGYLGLIRSNGRVDLWSPATGTLAFAQTSVDPKTAPVRLTLRCVGSDISLAVNGTRVLSVSDSTYASGYFGIQDYSLGTHDDVVATQMRPADTEPSLTSLSPAAVQVRQAGGATEVTVTINGSGFSPSSYATFNSIVKPTTYVSSTVLQMRVSYDDLKAASIYPVSVFGAPALSRPTQVPAATLPFVVYFADVPPGHWAYDPVNLIATKEITHGIGNNNYGPDYNLTRAQMAVFLLTAKHGAGYTPPPCTGLFSDVACPSGFAVNYIEQFYHEGVTAGCGVSPLSYCPDALVERQQMAVFLLRAHEPAGYTPPACTGFFGDVSCPGLYRFADYEEEIYRRGIDTGCGNGNFCPLAPVSRALMAQMVARTWGYQMPY